MAHKPVGGQLGSKKLNSLKARVNAHEQDLADRLEGVRQPLSGAISGYKGDIKLDHFLLDSKETSADTLGVSRADIVKINREACGERKEPGLVLTWNKMAEGCPKEWVMIPLEVFQRMVCVNKQDDVLHD
jgi:hypothetical protein